MANQKLNEVTTVPTASINNVKTFLAVMNDGSIQQMTKADMASVLGGLIAFPFTYRGVMKLANDAIQSGIYSINTGLNPDPALPSDIKYGTLIVFVDDTFGWISQLFICTTSVSYVRCRVSEGNWSNYSKISSI